MHIESYEDTVARLVDSLSRSKTTISQSAICGLLTNFLIQWDEQNSGGLWKRSDPKPFTLVKPGDELPRVAGRTAMVVSGFVEHSELFVRRVGNVKEKGPQRLIAFSPQMLPVTVGQELAEHVDAFFCVDPYQGDSLVPHPKYNRLRLNLPQYC